MTKPSQILPSILRRVRLQRTVLPMAICCLLAMLAIRPAPAQTFSVIHAFTGGGDGAYPAAGVTIGGTGTLYGTMAYGGGINGRTCDPRQFGCGTAFKMTRNNGGWILSPLYKFTGFNDGTTPMAPVVFGPGGLLYGSTILGGNVGVEDCNFGGCGVVFTLQPPSFACPSALCNWTEVPIYQFTALTDGFEPMGSLAFDQAGNIYGTTAYGGNLGCDFGEPGCGTAFQLTRSGNTWTKTTVHNFGFPPDGALPASGVIIDRSGNLYGTAEAFGPNDNGIVFELSPSGSGWTETVIYSFEDFNDGGVPRGGLVMDAAGNLYGTASDGGTGRGGTVFELSPSGGGWSFSVLASFSGIRGGGSRGSLAFDSAGNLYGTTWGDGAFGYGNVFKLTHSGGQWVYSDLYDFTNGNDGGAPPAGVTLDSAGNIYGTAGGGAPCSLSQEGCGVVWEITP